MRLGIAMAIMTASIETAAIISAMVKPSVALVLSLRRVMTLRSRG